MLKLVNPVSISTLYLTFVQSSESCEPKGCKSISLRANELLVYDSASWEVISLRVLSQKHDELRTCKLAIYEASSQPK